jgi:hypothetical protein
MSDRCWGEKNTDDETTTRAARAMACGVPHSIARNKITMSAIAQQAQVAKTVAVSTGKVANAKSMMVWRPHGNKYVRARDFDSRATKKAEESFFFFSR